MASPRGTSDSQRSAIQRPSWGVERWTAVIVLMALGILILIRMGFRGVNVLGVNASVS